MKIDKQEVVDLLNDRGQHLRADRAAADLPQQVDTQLHSDLLDRLDIDPRELMHGEGTHDNASP